MTPAEREAWIEERRSYIGGSDAAAACSLNPYKTAYKLYQEKRAEIEPDDLSDNDRVKWGTRLEAAIVDGFAEDHGERIQRVHRVIRHAKYPFLAVNLDARFVGKTEYGERGFLEAKNCDGFAYDKNEEWGEPGTDQVPTHYFMQCQHGLFVTGYDYCKLATLVGGNRLHVYVIMRDETAIKKMVEKEIELWSRIVSGDAPAIESYDDAFRIFPEHAPGKQKEIDDQIRAFVDEFRAIKATESRLTKEKKDLEDKIDELKGRIIAYMGDAEIMTDLEGKKILTAKLIRKSGHTVKPSEYREVRITPPEKEKKGTTK